MPANLHTHPECLHYDTTPSYTTAYHFPLNKLTPFFVLSYLLHLPPLPQVLLIAALFLPCSFSLLPQQQAAEHSGDHHSTSSVSSKDTCKKSLALLQAQCAQHCFGLADKKTCQGWSTSSGDCPSSIKLLTSLERHSSDRGHKHATVSQLEDVQS